jgi:hypothetical protein
MTIPAKEPDIDTVRAAALKLAETEDEHFMAYPERFITAMPRSKAQQWQRRLSVMNEDRPCADRLVLLGTDNDVPS